MVIAVGGGDQARGETRAIDAFALAATGVSQPRVVFLPTGTKDAPEYGVSVAAAFQSLGAGSVTTLALTRNPARAVVEAALAQAHLVYLGGGSASLLAKHGQRYDLGRLLAEARDRGAVLEGISGGAIALFDGGYGAYNGYRPLPGWGLAPGHLVPHFHPPGSNLPPDLAGPRGLWGLEDGAALVWDGQKGGTVRHRAEAACWALGPGGAHSLEDW